MNVNIPVLLLPLKIETRFVDSELWIRVFPDEVFLEQHNPFLSNQELEDAKAFKGITVVEVEAKKKAWRQLVSKYGAYRAAWMAHIPKEALTGEQIGRAHV